MRTTLKQLKFKTTTTKKTTFSDWPQTYTLKFRVGNQSDGSVSKATRGSQVKERTDFYSVPGHTNPHHIHTKINIMKNLN